MPVALPVKTETPSYSGDESPRARVLRTVRDWIDSGRFAPGHPLPSERVLAEQLGVARPTVRQALAMLSDEGIIRSNGGKLRLVAPRETSRHSSLLSDAIVVLTLENELMLNEKRHEGWVSEVSYGALAEVRAQGFHVVSLQPERIEQQGISSVAALQPFGVVISEVWSETSRTAEWARELQGAGVPLAVYGGSPSLSGFDRISSDHVAGSYALTRLLLEQGRRRIVCLWPQPAVGYWFAQRYEGYEKAMREAGMEALPPIKYPLHQPNETAAEFENSARSMVGFLAPLLMASEPVDALLCGNDIDALIAARACRMCHREPGRDVLITGYDNIWNSVPEFQHESQAPFATADKRNNLLGRELVRLLQKRVSDELPPGPQSVVVTPHVFTIED